MRKASGFSIGLGFLVLGTLVLSADRIFVSADSGAFGQQMTVVTIVALIFFLVGAVWIFKSAF